VRFSNLLVVSALVGALAPLPLGLKLANAGDGMASRADVMQLKDVKPGMKGYGLTVFEGTKPDRFDIEVIGVLDNFRPRQDLILIKTMHPRLDVAKVVAGMSGSPIYINGKMIGAYAYGWTFGREPVAGVTPIRNMLEDIDRPLPKMIDGWPLRLLPAKSPAAGKTADLGQRYRGTPGEYDLKRHAEQLAKSSGAASASHLAGSTPLIPVATPLLLGGISGSALGVAKELLSPLGLEPLQAGGGASTAEANAPAKYVDGGAIGVQLIRGDMNAMGLGTVTRVEGDKLVGFGHPMMQGGVTALPTAVGRVLWFLASDMRSFKIGVPSRPLGALVQDRQASIVVSQSATAPIIPVTMNIKGVPGAPYTSWKFEVAHEKFMTPSFLSIALGSALQATASERQDVSWTAKSRLKVRGHGEIQLEDFGVAIGGTPEAEEFVRTNLIRAAGTLMNNPWEPVFIESAHMDVELRYARDILRLRGAELMEPEIEAGQPARVRLTLVPYAGSNVVQRVITVPIPAYLAGQTVNLEIGPGYTKQREMAAPETVAELVQNLQDVIYPAKSVVVSFDTGDGAVSYKGRVARHLPPSAIDALRPTTTSIAPETFGSETRISVPLDQFMTGRDRVSVVVKPVLR
jgi:hypothetical protein